MVTQNRKPSKELAILLKKKIEETGQEEDKRRSGKPKKMSTTDEQYVKAMFLRSWKKKSRQVLTQDLKD